MALSKTTKYLARIIFTLKARIIILWQCRVVGLLFNLRYKIVRTSGELKMAEDFFTYLNNLTSQQRERAILDLKSGLTIASQKEVDKFMANKDYILKHNLIEFAKVFNQDDIEEQAECSRKLRKIKKELSRFSFNEYNLESFYGINGLRWLPEDVKARLVGGTFLDIGAYDGDSAVSFWLAFKPTKIYAFEPSEDNFKRLIINSELIGDNIVIPVKMGVSDQAGEVSMSNSGSSSKLSTAEGGLLAKVTTINNFAKTEKIERIGLIKMDIEGEEMKALLGSDQIIRRDKPVLAISIYHKPEDFFNIKPWLQSICPDYKFIIKKAHPFSFDRETMLLAY